MQPSEFVELFGRVLAHQLEADPASRAADAPPGWLRSNDLARMDDEGFVWIEGRVDDVLVRGGFKVSTEEVGRVLRSHPAVADAGVAPAPEAGHLRLGAGSG